MVKHLSNYSTHNCQTAACQTSLHKFWSC